MKLILGANGRLGTALRAELGDLSSLAPARAIYEDWWRPEALPAIGRYLESQREKIDTIFVACGVIDPAAGAVAHDRVNFLLPRQVIRAAIPLGVQVVTFGTMMETISTHIPETGYVASKFALSRFVEEMAQANRQALHLRVHTLYGGGAPDPFMFTGQMLAALQRREDFLMSPGTQLREYHHIDDEARAIMTLSDGAVRGVVDLNHGDPISLAELAQGTFRAFDALNLLRLGARPAPTQERMGLRFARTQRLLGHSFRDVRSAMIDYLQGYLPDSSKAIR